MTPEKYLIKNYPCWLEMITVERPLIGTVDFYDGDNLVLSLSQGVESVGKSHVVQVACSTSLSVRCLPQDKDSLKLWICKPPVALSEPPTYQMDAQGHAKISAESKRQIFQAIIECAKKAKTECWLSHYGGIQMIDPNLFIQELEKLLIQN